MTDPKQHPVTEAPHIPLSEMPDIDTDVLIQLLREAAVGQDPSASSLPRTPAIDVWRTKMEADVAELRAQGFEPDIPHSFPDVDVDTLVFDSASQQRSRKGP